MVKEEYYSVSPFFVFDEIKKGKTVYCLDKKERLIMTVNTLRAEFAASLIVEAENNSNRFVFWYEKEVKENETV